MSCMIYAVYDELIGSLTSIAPDYHKHLNPPAKEHEIARMEKVLEIALPSDLREFFKIRNGCQSDKLFVAFSLFTLDEIRSKTEEIREEFTESDRNFREGGWDRKKLVIGDSFAGWSLTVDCDSGVPFVYAQNNYALPLASSFTDYLIGLRANLRDGRYRLVEGEIFMDDWGQRF